MLISPYLRFPARLEPSHLVRISPVARGWEKDLGLSHCRKVPCWSKLLHLRQWHGEGAMQGALGVHLAAVQCLQECSHLCRALMSQSKGWGRDCPLLPLPQLSTQPLPFPSEQDERRSSAIPQDPVWKDFLFEKVAWGRKSLKVMGTSPLAEVLMSSLHFSF